MIDIAIFLTIGDILVEDTPPCNFIFNEAEASLYLELAADIKFHFDILTCILIDPAYKLLT
uniref:Uncharacterized protein n=1 Tax=Rhizophora mucronata TaxID=61149 RepID=A0A2P2QCG1_RHIMU